MAITAKWYVNGLKHFSTANVDWDGADDVRVALMGAGYTPDQDAHDFFDDVSANEATGTGYTAGGAALGSRVLIVDAATNEVRLDAADVSWANSTLTARYAVVYKKRGGVSSADELLMYIDFGGPEQTSAGTFSIFWATDGVIKLVAA